MSRGGGQMTAASASIEASPKALGEEEKKKKVGELPPSRCLLSNHTSNVDEDGGVSFVFKCQVEGFQLLLLLYDI